MLCKEIAGVLLGASTGLLFAGSASAQSFNVLASLSADDGTALEVVRDQDLVLQAAGGMAHVTWPSETLSLFAGDNNGANALHTVFTDVDAVAHRLGGQTAAQSLLISITSDEAGFKDGDVLTVGATGFEVYIPEADFITATGATDGNVDIDALQVNSDGTVLFSFGDNEISSILSGDTAGTIKDGDILTWVPGNGQPAAELFNEVQVNGLVSHALGATTTTTDTTSLAHDPVTGATLFSVQSPTAQDATVFSTANGGIVVPGHGESDFGFTVGPELDALDVPSWLFPALTVSSPNPAMGSTLTITLRDAQPNTPYVLLAAFKLGTPVMALSGWGAAVLAHDAALVTTLNSASSLLMLPDALGTATRTASIPSPFPATDFVLQVMKPGPAPQGSNPVLIEVAQ